MDPGDLDQESRAFSVSCEQSAEVKNYLYRSSMSKSHGMPHVLVGYYLSDLRGFAAVNGLDDKNDGEVRAPRARSFQKQSEQRKVVKGLWRDCCSVSAVLCDQPRPKNVASSHDIFYPFHNIFYRLGVRRRNDLERAVAFRAVPKMTYLPLIPILGPFGGNQLIVALKAVCPEA